MKIIIETIPHASHRYPTVGDWWRDKDDVLQIRVSDLNNELYEVLIAVHELIEVMLCEERGITEKEVSDFDKSHLADDDPYVKDPGSHPDAPYHKEHVFAECIERLLALELGVNWQQYDAALLGLDQ